MHASVSKTALQQLDDVIQMSSLLKLIVIVQRHGYYNTPQYYTETVLQLFTHTITFFQYLYSEKRVNDNFCWDALL